MSANAGYLRCASVILALLIAQLPVTAGADRVAEIYVRTNQVGYRPSDVKVALGFGSAPLPEKFSVVDAVTQHVVLEGKARPVAGKWGQFEHHVELNFSALKRPGRYFIRFGSTQSVQFEVSATAYSDLPDQLLEFMRQ